MRHFLNGSIKCSCTKCAQEEKKDNLTDEEKKEEELKSLRAELMAKSHEELDKIKEDLQAEIDELTDKKKKDSKSASRKYSIIGYDNALYSYNATAGDRFLVDHGSVD